MFYIFKTKMEKKRLWILKQKVAVTSSMLSFYENIISYRARAHISITFSYSFIYGGSSYDFKRYIKIMTQQINSISFIYAIKFSW